MPGSTTRGRRADRAVPALKAGPALLEVVYCRNPLRPASDRQVHRLAATCTDTVDSLVKRLGLQGCSLVATINGAPLSRRRWGRKRVHPTDVLVLMQRARDPIFGTAWFAYTWAEIASAAIGAFVSSELFVAIVLTVVANALTPKPGSRDSTEKGANSFSIEGGANQSRAYGPLPLVLGEHRMFPDYASRPFSEFVPDAEIVVINNTPRYESQSPPAFDYEAPASPWTAYGVTGAYVDNQPRTLETPDGTIVQPHTFVARHVVPGDSDPPYDEVTDWEHFILGPEYEGGPVNNLWRPFGAIGIIVGYGYTINENTERLTSIFNFGLGDLSINDLKVGSTPLDSFNSWTKDESVVPSGQGDRTELTGYTSETWSGDKYPTAVATVEGGKLEQNDAVENDGWVEREGPSGAPYVQIDIAGRLFRQGGGGVESLSCDFEVEYQAVGSATWTAFAFSPITITNGDTTAVRNTYAGSPGVDVSKIRVRRTTPDSIDANSISEMEFLRAKWFRVDIALYPAQHRLGLIIKATGQLNGRIDRLSALAKAKHWKWASGAPWTSSLMPGDDAAPWTWTETTNPAWLFLYYSRGGFLNPTAEPDYLGLQGWLDRPDPSNGPRLFGAGLTNDRIDYASIVAWGQWCDSMGLSCRMVIDTQRRAGDVLDDIAAAGRARKTWATGRLGVWWEAAGQPFVAAFGMSNIIAGSFKIAYDAEDAVDEYALDYTRSDDDYNGDTVYAAVPGAPQLADQRTERAVASMPRAEAQRLVNLLAASQYYHRRRITWEAALEGLAVQTGDVVALAHDLTRWAYSGRLISLTVSGDQVSAVRLACLVDNPGAETSYFLWIRKPDGSSISVECAPPTAPTRELTVVGAWPTAIAPEYIDQAGTENTASVFPGTIPEDWSFLAGPTPTPGKRARIIGMTPATARRVRFTARDESAEYYPLEYGLEGAPALVSGEQLIARAFNLAATPAAAGGWRLAWELEAAQGANVNVSVNGGAPAQVPISGHLTVAGTELLLPAYAPGSVLSISVLPVAAGTPVAVRGDSLTMTV